MEESGNDVEGKRERRLLGEIGFRAGKENERGAGGGGGGGGDEGRET